MVWGVGLLMGDRAAEAAKVFQRGIDEKALPDDNPAFHFYLAGALAMADRTDEALAAARTAAEKKKDSARFRGRAAWVLYIAKRYDEADEGLPRADRRVRRRPRVGRNPRRAARGAAGALEPLRASRATCPRPRSGSNRCSTSFPTTTAP